MFTHVGITVITGADHQTDLTIAEDEAHGQIKVERGLVKGYVVLG